MLFSLAVTDISAAVAPIGRVGDGSVGHGSIGHMGRHYSMGHMGHGSVAADPRRPIIFFNIWNICVAVLYSRINCVCNDKW